MTRKERYAAVTRWFSEKMPAAQSELHYSDPFQLLLAVVLSAQCTDKRVNIVTPALFGSFPSPESLAGASFDEVYPLVKSVSYPNSKTRHLIELSQKLVSDFGGQVPSDIDSLMSLPGVGRKTANVIASIIFNQPVIAVDTHVFRVSHRLGLSDGKTPEAVEKDLERYFAVQDHALAHHWLILHGRYVCTARKPDCDACGLKEVCRYFTNCSRSRTILSSALSPLAPK